ncbi:MAG TPA: hypothetical protein PLV50_12305 [Smithella sp.]|nr:hypothetical protein [Smithella sp.]MDM7986715.1 hypothetical protein [Smithella sp.]HNY51391.1 hypothetical protein [Smithella sp.]HOG91316.1 hypothetical protein [Smithella sp.]HOU51476.1 hypothetical protein [Smithella sp.]
MMNDFLEYISTWSVLKWIVLVLIAGFIGQFGRMAAEAIAAKIRARRGNKEPVPEVSREPFASTPPAISSTNAPPDKKLLKAMAKAKKKEAKKKS